MFWIFHTVFFPESKVPAQLRNQLSGSYRVPAACHFIAAVEVVAGREACMAQSIEVVDVAVGHMDAVHVFLAIVEIEDEA